MQQCHLALTMLTTRRLCLCVKPLWHGCCIMLSESRSQKGRGEEQELGTEEQTKSPEGKSESLEPKT